MHARVLSSIFVCLSFLVSAPAYSATQVELFSPDGQVKGVRQVQARFTAEMVALGNPRLPDPFDIDCAAPGKGRWADGRNWIYDFDADLPGGLQCRFTLKADAKDSAGKALEGERRFQFDTGGPAIILNLPRNDSAAIDEEQVFILGLDQPATRASIEANAWCSADGINERIDVRIIEGQERARLLAARNDFADRFKLLFYKSRGLKFAGAVKVKDQRIDSLPVVILQCKRRLPAEAAVVLHWDAGIRGESGLETTEPQNLQFTVRRGFSARFSCERVNAKAPCLSFRPLQLDFSAAVKVADAQKIVLTDASGKTFRPTIDKGSLKTGSTFSVSFTAKLAEKSTFTISLPADFHDDAGRPLENATLFPLEVKTDELPPLMKFPARFGIVELKGDRTLPVTLRNLEATVKGEKAMAPAKPAPPSDGRMLVLDQDEEIMHWLTRMDLFNRWGGNGDLYDLSRSLFARDEAHMRKIRVPKPAGGRAFEVVGIPLRTAGFHVVELESERLGGALNGNGGKAYVSAAALVTNMAAHFKHGQESSLVWVTTLDRAQPVAGADVTVRDCNGKVAWQGRTDRSGVANIRKPLTAEENCSRDQPYFISARRAGDMTFTLSSWGGGIQSWRFGLPSGEDQAGNEIRSTVFDRTLLRAGETVHMKHFARKHSITGVASSEQALPPVVRIEHRGSNQKYTVPLTWSARQTAESVWKIPADAKLGEYAVMLGNLESGTFRVEAFRVPTMRALIQGPREAAVQAEQIALDLQLNYLSGGAAGNAPVKLRTLATEREVSFTDYADFAFDRGDVKEGRSKGGGYFEDQLGDEDLGTDEGGAVKKDSPAVRTLTLDGNGAARVVVDKLGRSGAPRSLVAELEYQDANGETLTATERIALWPSRVHIGIKADNWIGGGDQLRFQAVVLDLAGKPVANAQLAIDFFEQTHFSHRRRLLGGFYAYENGSETRRIGRACEGTTDAKGLLVCAVKPPRAGNLLLRAATADAQGLPVATQASVWVGSDEERWFGGGDNDRIDLLPEKKRYEPGETAVMQVRMPFRTATALVTVEREGIIDSWLQPLSGKDPQIKVPIKGHYAPNVYVSAFVVRGRVGAPKATALLDLGKPSYKMGMAHVRVGWQAHELDVKVTTDKEAYQVREKAKVKVKVTRADGSALPRDAEVTLAAVDEGLLELKANTSWKLLDAMLRQRGLQVQTSTAQMQVIGKRHYGRKAVPAGGSGGKGNGRELFDTLLFWQASVKLDENGEAEVEVPLNDSLSQFRIVAVANAGTSLFGDGKAQVRATQDLILLSGLPPVVRQGDRLRAGFTLRNASKAEMQVSLKAQAGAKVLPPQTAALAAGEAREFAWDVEVPNAPGELAWQVEAAAEGGATDSIRVKQKVTLAHPVRVLQATLLQLERAQSLTVQAPGEAISGLGGIEARLSPKLANGLPGVEAYMREYAYTCLEQQASKAIALHDRKAWDGVAAALPSWLDGDGLAKYFSIMRYGSTQLTAYLLAAAHEADYPVPHGAREKMLGALAAFVDGRLEPHDVFDRPDRTIRRLAALEALSRYGAATAAQADSITPEPNLWPTAAVIDWYLIMQRLPQARDAAKQMQLAERVLRSRLNFQGTTMTFSTERTDDLWWLMINTDTNANRLLLAMRENPAWAADMGRLARGSLGRQLKGRWNTTVANVWGVLAMDKFSARFEREPVGGSASLQADGSVRTLDWSKNPAGGTLSVPWPAQPGKQVALELKQQGSGKPWAIVQSTAALPLTAPFSSGYRLVKTVTPVMQKVTGLWSRGDVMRIRLDLEAQSDMTWVVVDDPVPSGATILGTGLGRDSSLLASGEKREGWVWPAFEERSFQAFRAYYQFVPKGKWTVEYTVRLNSAGEFALPATHVEAMYAPEMLGDYPNPKVVVKP